MRVCLSVRDGIARSGTFLVIHSQLERLKTEGVVDVFQAVRAARIQRPGVIPNNVYTVICYDVMVFDLSDFVFVRITISTVMKYWQIMWRRWKLTAILRL